MDLKVVCYCGQKYKFDVEPVNGRMPHTVNCPVCGVDGTPLANQLISQQLFSAGAPPVPVMAAPAPAMMAPAPMAVPASAMAAPAPTSAPPPLGGGLKINLARPAEPAVPPPLHPSSVPPPLGSSRPIAPIRPAVVPKKEQKEFSLGLGILGAFIGAAIGAGILYAFFEMIGIRFPLIGTITGLMCGYGARWMARGTDMTLGAIAGALALISLGGTFYFIYLQSGEVFVSAFISTIIAVGFAYRVASE